MRFHSTHLLLVHNLTQQSRINIAFNCELKLSMIATAVHIFVKVSNKRYSPCYVRSSDTKVEPVLDSFRLRTVRYCRRNLSI
jgi:hypothetical protein